MNKKQKALKERIEKVQHKPYGFQYMPKDWPVNLWDKKNKEVIDFLINKLVNTDDEVEYYTCLVYLITPDGKYNEYLNEWKDSKNYKKLKEIIEKPKEIIEKPKEIIEKPKEIIEKPKEIIEKPKEIIEKPKENIKQITITKSSVNKSTVKLSTWT